MRCMVSWITGWFLLVKSAAWSAGLDVSWPSVWWFVKSAAWSADLMLAGRRRGGFEDEDVVLAFSVEDV